METIAEYTNRSVEMNGGPECKKDVYLIGLGVFSCCFKNPIRSCFLLSLPGSYLASRGLNYDKTRGKELPGVSNDRALLGSGAAYIMGG